MFAGLTSYLWGEATPADVTTADAGSNQTDENQQTGMSTPTKCKRLSARPAKDDEDWMVVDTSSRDSSTDRFKHPQSACRMPFQRGAVCASTNSRLGGADSSSDSGSDISTLPDCNGGCCSESWLVTPPPCFTAGGSSPQRMETNPMEDLLIEHPSMSVYGPRVRQNSAGVDTDASDSGSDAQVASTSATRNEPRLVAGRCAPRHPHAIAARAGILAHVQTVKSAQQSSQYLRRHTMSRSAMRRSNRVHGTRTARGFRCQHQNVRQPAARTANRRC